MEISEELSGELYKKYGRELEEGEILFHEDDIADEFYVIISGKIKISKQIKSGKFSYEKILITLSSGEILGEMALLMPNSKRSASAYVIQDSKIIVIDRNTFYAMIRYNAEFSIKLMERLSKYVLRANKQLEELGVAQKQLLIIEELINKHEKVNKLEIKDITESKNILEHVEKDFIEKILQKLTKLEAISIDDSIIKIKSIDLLKKFKMLLTDQKHKE